MFKIIKKDRYTKARLGVLTTPHGKIETPSYVIVATHAQVKCLKPSDIKKTKTQVVIANTYHLWDEVLKSHSYKLQAASLGSFILNKLRIKLPTMTDSGGFQVFSLGFGIKNKVGKILMRNPVDKRLAKSFIHRQKNIKITQKGVYFLLDGRKRFLGPKLSMQIQKKLGADIIFAFDECTSPLDDFDYNKKALERTHKWAQESLKFKVRSEKLNRKHQLLFGIIQGGKYKSLRIKSAKYIASLPFDGIGIGGSFGNLPVQSGPGSRVENEMAETLKWVIPHLPEEKPRHLLGIGKIEDVFNAVEQGIDLFDCVIPTREARHGRIYTKAGYFNISKFRNIKTPLGKECRCPVCKSRITRAKLCSLFKSSQTILTDRGKRYATIHNVWFFNNLMEEIRESIKNNKFKQVKNKFLNQFKSHP